MGDQPQVKEPPLYLMFLLICIGTIGGVLYSPALPEIAKHFNVSSDRTELTMTAYLLGYALGQLPYGPISNRFGRRPALYIGLTIASISALVSAVSGYTSLFWLLVVSRFLFAVGASVGIQVVFTIIGDFYKPPRSSQVASYLTLAFAIGPSIGITIGGFLTQYLTWESCFYFLSIYCIFLILFCRKLPETCLEKDQHALKVKNIVTEYVSKFKDQKVVLSAVLIGSVVAFSYIFATVAPFIGIEVVGLDPFNYGLLNLLPSLGLVFGALSSALLAKHLSSMKILKIAVIVVFLGVIPMLLTFLFGIVNVYTLFIPFTIALIGQPIIEANILCLVLHDNANKSTTAAIINFVNLSVCVIFVVAISFPKSVVPISMPLIFSVLSVLALLVYKN